MIILDGKAVSNFRRKNLKEKIQVFTRNRAHPPHLVVVLVGSDPASKIYVNSKIKACEEVGIKSTKLQFPETLTQAQLNAEISKLNKDISVDAVLVQLPLPKGLSEGEINKNLDPKKDVDGLTYFSLGQLLAGQSVVNPCTPQGIMHMLEFYNIPAQGKRVVVVGRSNIVGKPMAQLMLKADATVTICHSKTQDLRTHTLAADIVVVAAGKKHFLSKQDFKKGAVVIDVGIHRQAESPTITGDVNMAGLEDHLFACTPVPGGVGPMTITTLLENTLVLAEANK